MTIEEVLAKNEKQIFDRKSIQIKPVDLSDTICAFANADGGTIAIGISDKHRRIEGVDYHEEQLNEILRTPIDFCNPTVPITTEMVECVKYEGKPDHVLLMHIEASPLLHANQADEAFLRVGDKSKELEAIGLPHPVFNNSTFILKTTVMSADRDQRNAGNARIESENARIGEENARIKTSNPWIDAKNAWIEHIRSLHEKGMMTAITSTAIIAVLEDLRENQVIGTQDVQKILDCKETKALRIITEMKKAEVIVAVTGQGKGRYILNDKS